MPQLLLPSLVLSACAAGLAHTAPTPPCAAPAGIVDPAVPESLCFTTVVPPSPRTGVTIRSYGLPVNETLFTAQVQGIYQNALPQGLQLVFSYLSGNNDESRNILTARTTPILAHPVPASNAWTVSMMVSTAQFPDDFLIPRPSPPTLGRLSRVGARLIAAFQFDTTGAPYAENFEEACGSLNNTIPSGYVVNATSPFSPTYVLYNAEAAANFTSECWFEVTEA
jgi:hypothetical protein